MFLCSRVNDTTRITNSMFSSKFVIFCLTVILLGLVQPCGNSKVIIKLSPKYILLVKKIIYIYFMHGVQKCKKNLNKKSYLYRHVFVTDREKANFLKECFFYFCFFFFLLHIFISIQAYIISIDKAKN